MAATGPGGLEAAICCLGETAVGSFASGRLFFDVGIFDKKGFGFSDAIQAVIG